MILIGFDPRVKIKFLQYVYFSDLTLDVFTTTVMTSKVKEEKCNDWSIRPANQAIEIRKVKVILLYIHYEKSFMTKVT